MDKFKIDCLDKGFRESTMQDCSATVEKLMKKKSSVKKCASMDQYLANCGMSCAGSFF